MPYKIEILSTQYFPDGKFLNHSKEYWFEDDHELTARRQAFEYLWSISPEDSSEYNIALFYCYDYWSKFPICTGILYPLSDYNEEELENRIYNFDFDVENLHQETFSYIDAKYDTGGEPIILDDYLIYDEEGNEIEPVALAMNKEYLKYL